MTDIDRSPLVLSGVVRVERLDDGGDFGVGTRWRETRRILGREGSEVIHVTAVDEGARSYVAEADNRGTHYVSTVSVAPAPGGGSTLRMTFGSEQSGLAGRLVARTLGRAFQGATRTALAQDLADVATAAEADAAAADEDPA